MKMPLRVGAHCAPDKKAGPVKTVWRIHPVLKRAAGAGTALVLVAGVGASSAIFVDYLADRAKLRAYAAATRMPAESRKSQPPAPKAAIPASTASLVAGSKPEKDAASVARAAKAAAAQGSLPLTGGAKPIGPQPPLPANVSTTAAAAVVPPSDAPRDNAIADAEPMLAVGDEVEDEMLTSAIPLPHPQPDERPADKVEKKDTGRVAKVLKYVNLRSRPADESKVLTVVPAKASVNVLSCKSWCEVEYAGTKGFIYKRFIGKS